MKFSHQLFIAIFAGAGVGATGVAFLTNGDAVSKPSLNPPLIQEVQPTPAGPKPEAPAPEPRRATVTASVEQAKPPRVDRPEKRDGNDRPERADRPPRKRKDGGRGQGRRGGKGRATGPVGIDLPYRDLWIPTLVEGPEFHLSLGKNRKSFWGDTSTATYSYNNAEFWGPTLVFNRGETVELHVKNNLDEETTCHWHGLHLPAEMDGGPHQLIPAGKTWTSTFLVNNNAATYWYHPHPHEETQKQMTYGAGGLIIIRDPIESKLALPRTYGVDDIPLVFTSRRFYANNEFSFEGDADKYGDYVLANGVMKAQVELPAQLVRLRILNAEIERGYVLGFSDNRTFHVITTDGGLVDKPIPLKRTRLMVGERVEILVDLSNDSAGSTLDLMAYNEGLAFGFPGAEPGQRGINGSLLNNKNFPLLRINVGRQTTMPITEIPAELTRNRFWTEAEVDNRRELSINKLRGGSDFTFDRRSYDMHKVEHVVKLGDVEAWTIYNPTFGHSFHIHDVQFKIISRTDGPVPAYEQGWKDTCYVPRGTSVTFLAKFENHASDTNTFMYHCHMANHEDAGLMGQFLVSRDPSAIKRDADGLVDLNRELTPGMVDRLEKQSQSHAPDFNTTDINGNPLSLTALTAGKPLVLYFIESACPCAREAAPFLDQLRETYADSCNVIGVINANTTVAKAWAKRVGNRFPLIADPDCEIIKAYGAEAAAYTTLVSPDRVIIKTHPGYSAQTLRELAAKIARESRSKPQPLSLADAPAELVVGCPLVSEL